MMNAYLARALDNHYAFVISETCVEKYTVVNLFREHKRRVLTDPVTSSWTEAVAYINPIGLLAGSVLEYHSDRGLATVDVSVARVHEDHTDYINIEDTFITAYCAFMGTRPAVLLVRGEDVWDISLTLAIQLQHSILFKHRLDIPFGFSGDDVVAAFQNIHSGWNYVKCGDVYCMSSDGVELQLRSMSQLEREMGSLPVERLQLGDTLTSRDFPEVLLGQDELNILGSISSAMLRNCPSGDDLIKLYRRIKNGL